MQTTKNLGLRKPEENDLYSVDDLNYNADVIDSEIQAIKEASNPEALKEHTSAKNNPHGVTKEQIGLGNVPNVETNDQTPVYTVPGNMDELTSGEKLSVAFGKIAKAVKSLISHIADSTIHVTSTEKTTWNEKANGTHKHTKSEITDFPSTMPPSAHSHSYSDITGKPSSFTPSAHNQAASTITAGTLGGAVVANATAVANLGTKQVRNIYTGTAELTAGLSALPTGDIYIQYE